MPEVHDQKKANANMQLWLNSFLW